MRGRGPANVLASKSELLPSANSLHPKPQGAGPNKNESPGRHVPKRVEGKCGETDQMNKELNRTPALRHVRVSHTQRSRQENNRVPGREGGNSGEIATAVKRPGETVGCDTKMTLKQVWGGLFGSFPPKHACRPSCIKSFDQRMSLSGQPLVTAPTIGVVLYIPDLGQRRVVCNERGGEAVGRGSSEVFERGIAIRRTAAQRCADGQRCDGPWGRSGASCRRRRGAGGRLNRPSIRNTEKAAVASCCHTRREVESAWAREVWPLPLATGEVREGCCAQPPRTSARS